VALAVTLLTLAMIAVFLSVAFLSVDMTGRVADRYRDHVVAAEAARAGLATALYELSRDADWDEGFAETRLTHSGATCSVTFEPGAGRRHSTNNRSGASQTTGYGGRAVPAGCTHLVSVGRYGKAEAISEALVDIGPIPPLRYAVAAQGRLTLDGSSTDSWDSSQGSYSATRSTGGGDVRTNAAARDRVRLRGSSVVRGDVTVGPGGSSSTVDIARGSSVTGSISAASEKLSLAFPIQPAGSGSAQTLAAGSHSLAPGTYGDVSLVGATLNLTGGSYVFESLTAVSSTLKLAASESTAYIYVLGRVTTTSLTVSNDTGVPGRLWLTAVESGKSWSLDLAKDAYMVIYAPGSTISIEDGAIYGAVVGETVRLEDSGVHFDQALRTAEGPAGGLTLLGRWGD
jgi:hypothetical protein